jgi:hypothetical protein
MDSAAAVAAAFASVVSQVLLPKASPWYFAFPLFSLLL